MSISVPDRTGNYGPEVESSASCEKFNACQSGASAYPLDGGETIYFVPGDSGPLTVTFPAWVAGDVLEVGYDAILFTEEEAELLPIPTFHIAVSVNGSEWFGVNGSESQCVPVSDDTGYQFSTPAARVSVPIATGGTVVIRAVYVTPIDMLGRFRITARQLNPDCVLSTGATLVELDPQPIPIP